MGDGTVVDQVLSERLFRIFTLVITTIKNISYHYLIVEMVGSHSLHFYSC